MNSCVDPGMERLQYTDGALLLRADLTSGAAGEARRMALHVRGLHATWGVASGLRLQWNPVTRSVGVGQGAGFDCRGNVIVLSAPVQLPLPDSVVAGVPDPAFDLLLDGRGVRWEATGKGAGSAGFGAGVRVGVDIPLGRFIRFGPGFAVGPDYSVRKSVRPVARPYLGFGVTAPDELTWLSSAAMLRAVVDTSAAEFSTTPYYTAQLVDPPALAAGLIGPFVSLAWFGPQRFVIRVSAISRLGQPAATVLANLAAAARTFRVAWMGVEPLIGCSTGAPGGYV